MTEPTADRRPDGTILAVLDEKTARTLGNFLRYRFGSPSSHPDSCAKRNLAILGEAMLAITTEEPAMRTDGKYEHLSGDARDAVRRTLAAEYAGGDSIRTLAALHNYSYGKVHRLLKESTATLRGHGGYRHGTPRNEKPETVQEGQ